MQTVDGRGGAGIILSAFLLVIRASGDLPDRQNLTCANLRVSGKNSRTGIQRLSKLPVVDQNTDIESSPSSGPVLFPVKEGHAEHPRKLMAKL